MSLEITCPDCRASNAWLPGIIYCKSCQNPLATPVLPHARVQQLGKLKRKLWQILTLWLVWATVGAVLYVANERPQTAAASAPPTLSGPSTSSTPEVSCAYPAHLVDNEGKTIGECEVMLLAKDYVWVQGSGREIENIGDIFQRGTGAFSLRLQQEISESPEVVVIGTADAKGKRDREEARAGARGRNLAQALSVMKGDGRSVFSVDLGQWLATEGRNIPLDDQRRIIIIRVLSRDRAANFGIGLRNALVSLQNEQPVLRDVLNGYSNSEHFTVR